MYSGNCRGLSLNNNGLTGSLPADFGAGLPSLTTIDFSSNTLSGSLPGSIGTLTKLTCVCLMHLALLPPGAPGCFVSGRLFFK